MRARLIKPVMTGQEQIIAHDPLQAYTLDPTLDWRNHGGNFVTPVRDQGNCGSCWAFGTAGALESYLLISQPTTFNAQQLDLAEQILVSCSGAGDCNGGYIDQASNYVLATGLPPESYDPYKATNGSCGSAHTGWQQAAQKSHGWQWVTTTSASVSALKSALAAYGPLITTMDVYSDFMYYTSGIYHYVSGSLEGGHAILLVGYDDTNQCFIVKNSWGTSWGEQGFFRIAYSEISSRVYFGQDTIANVTPSCTFSISPASASPAASGGTGSVTVTASAGACGWSASSNSSWISLSPPGSGTGSGKVSYTVAANSAAQARNGTMTIAGKTFTVSQAAASIPTISVSPTSINFGSVRVGRTSASSVTISNKGTATLTINSITMTGQSASSFTQTNNCASLAANKSCTAQVTFKPSSTGSKSASLSISSNDSAHSPVSVSLSGTGN
jgi:hypothetical protein